MTELKKQIEGAAAILRGKLGGITPQIGIVLGTGLGSLADEIKDPITVPYAAVPHMPLSTVETHKGEFVFGKLGGKQVMAMKGRFHVYEGYSGAQVAFPVRVMKAMGVSTLLISNACGGMNRSYRPGDLMIIEDHINLLGANPLIGPNDDTLGPRWPDMIEPYDRGLIAMAESIASEFRIRAHRGTYVAVTGPNLETRAEYRMLSTFADVVGMSTVPEVIAAVHGGMKVLGISVITDECVADRLKPASITEIIRIAGEAEPKLSRIMSAVIERI
ncbi:MAG: purine-nucleoside phosphorylase [candidate division FCPU426 bacterium]